MNKRLLHEIRHVYVYLAAMAIFAAMIGLLIVVQAAMLTRIINGVFLNKQTLSQVVSLLMIFLATITGRALLIWGSSVVAAHVAACVKSSLRQRLFRHIQVLGPIALKNERSGELTATIVEGVEALDAFFRQMLPQVCATLLIPMIIGVVVFFTDILSGLILLITTPLLLRDVTYTYHDKEDDEHPALHNFGAFDPRMALVFSGCFLLSASGFPLLTYLLSQRAGQQQVEARSALHVHLVDHVQGLADLLAFGQEDRVLKGFCLLEQKYNRAQRYLAWINGVQEALGTLFMHATAFIILLMGIQLVRAGQLNGVFLAVLVLAALSSFEAILPLPSAFQDDIRHLISVVTQDTHLLHTTIRQNLLLAREEASEEEMIQAAQQARIHDFIVSLPRGYDTEIGEQGLRLSSGERQRLAIARALLKHAPILLLDEPTANLDAVTAHDIRQTLRELIPAHTTLLVTHHLADLEMADEVVILEPRQSSVVIAM